MPSFCFVSLGLLLSLILIFCSLCVSPAATAASASTLIALTGTERLIGDAATNQVATNPINIIFDAKMLIGRRLPLQNDIQHWPFKVIESPRYKPLTVINYEGQEKQFTAEEISSMVLLKMRQIAKA
ncbi:hypothetical protein Peur_010555 [Populus x canadensis]